MDHRTEKHVSEMARQYVMKFSYSNRLLGVVIQDLTLPNFWYRFHVYAVQSKFKSKYMISFCRTLDKCCCMSPLPFPNTFNCPTSLETHASTSSSQPCVMIRHIEAPATLLRKSKLGSSRKPVSTIPLWASCVCLGIPQQEQQ